MARTPKKKRTVRKAVASKRTKVAKPAVQPAAAKTKPAAKPAPKRKIAPARAGVNKTKGAETMTKTNAVESLFTADQFAKKSVTAPWPE